MNVLVAGGSGFVGRALLAQLSTPTVTSRNAARARERLPAGVKVVEWDPLRGPLPASATGAAEAVVNLIGENVGEGRWTAARKMLIRDSRVTGARNLVAGLLAGSALPRVVVNASAIGYYGDRGDEWLDERSAAGNGFLAGVAADWEAATGPLRQSGVRVVLLRIGLVLGRSGGALAKILPLFRWGLGGRLGSGQQWMSWIHLADLVGMILWAIDNEAVEGPLNAVTPEPVRNAEFTSALARAVRRLAVIPAPRFALRMGIGEFGDVLCQSQRVRPAAAERLGFQWRFPRLDGALANIVTGS